MTLLTPFSRLLASNPGKSKLTISLNAVSQQLIQSSAVPISQGHIRQVISLVCECVPWFCQIVALGSSGGECVSSPSTNEETTRTSATEGTGMLARNISGKSVVQGTTAIQRKENSLDEGNGNMSVGVKGLLIFGKREGRLIGREEVLAQFRRKKEEYERLISPTAG